MSVIEHCSNTIDFDWMSEVLATNPKAISELYSLFEAPEDTNRGDFIFIFWFELSDNKKKKFIVSGFDALVNHSYKPNISYSDKFEIVFNPNAKHGIEFTYNCYAHTPISLGDELTFDYRGLDGTIDGNENPESRKAITIDPKLINKYVGFYKVTSTLTIIIWLDQDLLKAQFGNELVVGISAESETQFFCPHRDRQIEFILDENDKVVEVVVGKDGKQIPVKILPS